MKALGSEDVPGGVWHCEIKFDGYRAVAVLNSGKVELWSRNRKPLTADYPGIAAKLAALRCRNAVIDGEIVALDAKGRSRFQLLQNRVAASTPSSLVYYAFDLMHLDGRSMMALPVEERSAKLAALIGRRKGPLQVSPVFTVEPSELFAAARRSGLEGIIAKKPGSTYEPGRRSGAWTKCKVLAEQEFVIGGYSAPQRSRHYFGALLVGYYRAGRLLYAGKVGTGFSEAKLGSLHGKFLRLKRGGCPFGDLPSERKSRFGTGMGAAQMRSVTWLKPSLVAQIRFAEWTDEGLLRQPAFLGLRTDKEARDVRREASPSRQGKLP
jgi:bifunctional non-homologous end joining protein LigD